MQKIVSILLLSISFSYSLRAQNLISGNKYPLTDFRTPLDIVPTSLSGSFGELRSVHFHSGLDIRTNRIEGYPVYATSGGYISRIRVQSSGYGYSVYIAHPNGFTSVYAHLQKFNSKLAARIKAEQYKNKNYEVDIFPKNIEFPVSKGTIIGWSGNTGSSEGPHLHFEIRDTKTEELINPQLFGFKVEDKVPPTISGLYVYRLNGKPFSELTPKQQFKVSGTPGNYSLSGISSLSLFGEVGFGIISTDKHSGISGTNGVYSIELKVDNQVVFKSTFERLSFETNRGIISYVDFPGRVNLGVNIQKSFKDPGNPSKIYSELVNNGRIDFSDGKTHAVQYTVYDVSGNKSTLKFTVNSSEIGRFESPKEIPDTHFPYNKANEYYAKDFRVKLGLNTLFDDLNFQYGVKPKLNPSFFSDIHQVHNSSIPVNSAYELWIKPDSTIKNYMGKAVIVSANGSSQGGSVDGEFIKTTVQSFGDFSVKIDTLPPTITPINIIEGKNMATLSKIQFKIRDNLSGIKSYNGYIDGKWVLMEYDTKTSNLWHTFDGTVVKGNHTFELIVEDMKNNIQKFMVNFIR